MTAPVIRTELRDVSALTNDPRNARKHDKRNLDAIGESLRRFGQQKPIVVDGEGVVIAGNGTLEAARRLGWKSITAAVTTLTPEQARAFALADNRTGELSDWDRDLLGSELLALSQAEVEMKSLGWTDFELEQLLGVPDFGPETDIPRLDQLEPIVCPNCGHKIMRNDGEW